MWFDEEDDDDISEEFLAKAAADCPQELKDYFIHLFRSTTYVPLGEFRSFRNFKAQKQKKIPDPDPGKQVSFGLPNHFKILEE